MSIPFAKLHGSGNDFILIDNRDGRLAGKDLPGVARVLCRRHFSVGADGLIAIENTDTADFRWRFFNADGSSAEMCGNGGRCAARFAREKGLAGDRLCFETLAGPIRAEVSGRRVKLELIPPAAFQPRVEIPLAAGPREAAFINTGVPHAVLVEEDLDGVEVRALGREIRWHARFQPAGTNVNFVRRIGEGDLAVRTYERGVEDETQACGTGVVACALVCAHRWGLASPLAVHTRGGEVLTVHFVPRGDGFEEVFLEGDTHWVYDGACTEEALEEALRASGH